IVSLLHTTCCARVRWSASSSSPLLLALLGHSLCSTERKRYPFPGEHITRRDRHVYSNGPNHARRFLFCARAAFALLCHLLDGTNHLQPGRWRVHHRPGVAGLDYDPLRPCHGHIIGGAIHPAPDLYPAWWP